MLSPQVTILIENPFPWLAQHLNIGIVFWSATSAILIFSLKIYHMQKGSKKKVYFLFWASLLTLMLLFDDLLMLHDVIFPGYLNLDEKVFYCFYGLSLAALLYFYREVILKTDYILFLLAVFFLGGAVISDVLIALGLKWTNEYLVEDGLKFLGIVTWFAYFARTSYRFIHPTEKADDL